MIIEEIPKGRRSMSNDGRADDDFDDLVFTIERNSWSIKAQPHNFSRTKTITDMRYEEKIWGKRDTTFAHAYKCEQLVEFPNLAVPLCFLKTSRPYYEDHSAPFSRLSA
jgi:hypothetical protein